MSSCSLKVRMNGAECSIGFSIIYLHAWLYIYNIKKQGHVIDPAFKSVCLKLITVDGFVICRSF